MRASVHQCISANPNVAFNDFTQFQVQAVAKIRATDCIVAELKGVFAPYTCFADIPRNHAGSTVLCAA